MPQAGTRKFPGARERLAGRDPPPSLVTTSSLQLSAVHDSTRAAYHAQDFELRAEEKTRLPYNRRMVRLRRVMQKRQHQPIALPQWRNRRHCSTSLPCTPRISGKRETARSRTASRGALVLRQPSTPSLADPATCGQARVGGDRFTTPALEGSLRRALPRVTPHHPLRALAASLRHRGATIAAAGAADRDAYGLPAHARGFKHVAIPWWIALQVANS
mmetsp:Transcript_24149/g.74755  ORF Transcript_24149/g.74755 Transcript_24149/m.74755 type:complete len:217 (+) Transcript_24149:210-860(+)